MDIILYKLQDETNDVSKLKTLTATETYTPMTVSGTLRNATSIINPIIEFNKDVTTLNGWNYAYIADFHRYYFVDNIVSVRVGITSISFRVDVLTSFLTTTEAGYLEGFIARTANSSLYQLEIPDRKVQLKSIKDISIYEPISSTGHIENITFSFSASSNVLISTTNVTDNPAYQDITIQSDLQFLTGTATIGKQYFKPYGNALSYVTDVNDTQTVNNVSYPTLSLFLIYCGKTSNAETFINNVLVYPFSIPSTVNKFDIHIVEDTIDIAPTYPLQMKKAKQSNSGYLVLKDFTLTRSNVTFLDYEPYTTCEVFIPFTGWVSLDIKKNINCRLLVTYNIDYTTGQATVFLINKTRSEIIYQTTSQIGVQVPVNTTNLKENELKDQNYTRNYFTGMLASMATAVAGAGLIASGYGAGAGVGMMLAGATGVVKTSADYINNENLLLDKAQGQTVPSNAIFGSFSGLKVLVRWTYPITSNFEVGTERNHHIEHFGLPSTLTRTISQLKVSGVYHTYYEITDLHTSSSSGTSGSSYSLPNITISEKEELEALCAKGIFI